MARHWFMGVVGSVAVHGAAAAAFLLGAADPPPGGTPVSEPAAISVELVRWPAESPSGGPPPAARSKPARAASESPLTGALPVSAAPGAPDAVEAGSGRETSPSTIAAAAVSDYFQILESHLSRHHRYPVLATGDRPEGTVRVAMIIGRNGSLLDAWIETSSGAAALDEAALETVRRAAPMPGVPGSLPGSIDLIVPLRFTRADREM